MQVKMRAQQDLFRVTRCCSLDVQSIVHPQEKAQRRRVEDDEVVNTPEGEGSLRYLGYLPTEVVTCPALHKVTWLFNRPRHENRIQSNGFLYIPAMLWRNRSNPVASGLLSPKKIAVLARGVVLHSILARK